MRHYIYQLLFRKPDHFVRLQINRIGVFLIFLLTIVCSYNKASAQTEYEEISVFVNVQGVGGVEVPALIKGEQVFLSVVDVFNFLKIRNIRSRDLDSISGFFISSDATFIIDKPGSKIIFQDKVFELGGDELIKTEMGLYLITDYFSKVFGLESNFNFRSLSVNMNTKAELPVVRELKQEMMRKNLIKLKGEQVADTTYRRRYPFFHFGMADWSVISTQQQTYGVSQTLANLTLGGVLAGGETNISLIYNTSREFREREQYYLWRRANNENKYVKQVMLGKVLPRSISSIYSPLVGFQVTNTPTTFRRSFDTYTITNTTQPGWIVELYVNNVLVDYTKADASGFYSFEVPLVYGNSEVRQRFYGPWGEERFRVENISIPFYFLPPGQLEYTVTGGYVEDDRDSKYGKANVNYGVSRRITVGGGVEYLSSVGTGPVMPFATASWRVAEGLLLSGEHTLGVRTRGILNYRRPSDAQIELNYTRFRPGQEAINFSYLEERKLIFSIPVRFRRASLFSRLTLNQIILPFSQYSTAEWLLSASVRGVGAHLGTYAFHSETDYYVYSNLSIAFRLPKGFLLTPQCQYDYNNGTLISMKWILEKHLFSNGYVNLNYEQNFKSNIRNIGLDLRYDLSFAQVSFSARRINDKTNLLQSARGSLLVNGESGYAGFNSRTNVGRGGLIMIPFLDLNDNGRKDRKEPKVNGLKLHVNGGRIEVSKKDTVVRIFDMEAFASYFIELDGNSFDNIGWQLEQKNLRVIVDPNQLKPIYIPVAVYSEASGTVNIENKFGTKGQGQIKVLFYNKDGIVEAQTQTESDGYYSHLGLRPGKYTIKIDPDQLTNLGMFSTPSEHNITISTNREGDVVDAVDFTITEEE